MISYLQRQNPLVLAGAAVLVVGALYWFTRQAVKDVAAGVTAVGSAAAETIAGVATGDNAITRGTPYEGAGIFGTLGGVTNRVLGGVPQRAGEAIGGWVYRLLHSDE